MVFTVSAVAASASTSNFNAGGGINAVSSTIVPDANVNRLSVTASTLVFTTNSLPTLGTVSTNLSSSPVITAKDANGSVDVNFDFTGVPVRLFFRKK